MKLEFHLLRFLAINVIWIITIFIMAMIIFFLISIIAFYWIGGDFLFSSMDILKSFKISLLCGPLCSIGSWFLYWYNTKHIK